MNTKLARAVLVAATGMSVSHATCVAAAEAESKKKTDLDEVVVTGTFIRGIAPVGSTVIGISEQEIQSSGVNDSNQLLGTLVPQSNFFMELPQPAAGLSAGISRVPIDRPQLRNVGNPFNNSGSTTLVMMDGHRVVTAGLEQAGVDIGLIPPGMIERQEIILDGVSALYGSDAVAGVINYITRKRFDGIQFNAQYSIADEYDATSVNATLGKSWGSGGIGFTYSFGENSPLYNKERPYTITRNYLEGGRLTGLACDGYSHDTVGTAPALRRFVATAGQTTLVEQTNYCDSNGNATLSPAQERHAGFLTFSQDLTDLIKFDMSALFSTRKTTQEFGPFTTTATVRSTSPYFRSLAAFSVPNTTTQSVQYSYGPVLGNTASNAETTVSVGQIAPTLTVELGSWQARGNIVYGKSKTGLHQATLDTSLQATYLNGTTLATALNPYDIAATQNRSLISNLVYDAVKDGIQQLYQAQVIADGPLFAIPGGDVRLAFGGEWNKTTFKRRNTDSATRVLGLFSGASSSEEAVFAELNAPIVGSQNARTGVHALILSASARWDNYEDFGDTFNPKLGLTYEPSEWASVHGSWGTSFRAPNAVDKLGTTGATLRCFGNSLLPGCTTFTFDLPPGYVQPPGNNVYLYLSGGTVADLKPETSDSWSVGVEIRPPVVPGLTLSGTYYSISFTDKIEIPPTSFLQTYLYFPETLQIDPTQAQIAAFAALSPSTGANVLNILRNGGYYTVYTRDGRTQNLGSVEVRGVDFAIRYAHETGFGSIDANINGTYQLKNEAKLSDRAPAADTLAANTSRLALTLGVGVNVGDFRTQATVQHRAGYKLDPSATRVPQQTSVGDFNLLNVSFRYNVSSESLMLRDLALTLTVNNVLDKEPPILFTTTSTTANGSTLGRLVQLGINKQF